MKLLIEMHDSDLRLGAVASMLDMANQLAKRNFEFVFCGNLCMEFVDICSANRFSILTGASREFSRS